MRCAAVCCQFLLYTANYVLKVALRRGMREQLSVEQPCERVKVGQLLGGWYSPFVIIPTKPNSFSAEIDNSWAGRWWPTWLTGLTCLMSAEKPEKMKIIKDDKNRLARKLTSLPFLPPSHTLTLSLFLSSYAPSENNTLWTTPSLHPYLGKSRFINSSEQGAWGKLHKKVKDEGS